MVSHSTSNPSLLGEVPVLVFKCKLMRNYNHKYVIMWRKSDVISGKGWSESENEREETSNKDR